LAEIAAIVEVAFTVTWPLVPAPEPLPELPLELLLPELGADVDEPPPPPPPQPETPLKIEAARISVFADRVPKFRVPTFNARSWGFFLRSMLSAYRQACNASANGDRIEIICR
jgi:hypothetical protein